MNKRANLTMITRKYFIASLLLHSVLQGNSYDIQNEQTDSNISAEPMPHCVASDVVEPAATELPSEETDEPSKAIAPHPSHGIRAVVFLGRNDPFLPPEQLVETQGIQVIGLKLPGSTSQFRKQIASVLEKEASATETAYQIQETVKRFYAKNDHPFIVVKIPEQEITEGVLHIRVIESHIGDVIIAGNTWFSTKLLKQFLGVKKGQEIDQSLLLRNMHFINQDPFLMADLIFSPGQELYTTDITLAVQERNSIRLYAGVDNTGIETVGRNRWFMGANWGNAFNLGHILSYQYTASYNRNQFQGMTAQYIAPLTWHHTLNIYGGYSEVTPHLSPSSMRNHGWSCQASLRYQIPLPIYQYLEQDIIFGGDFKRTNNNFEFSDASPAFGQNVNLTQLALEYKGLYEGRSYALNFDGSLFWSPGSWISDQTNHDYKTLRVGGKHTWVYFRGAFSYLQSLPAKCSFYLLSRGQVSSQNLLPSEQYGIGGYDTVRGYEERQLNKDSAFLTTIEIRSPRIPIIKRLCPKCYDSLQFLGFVDYGWGTDHTPEIKGFKTNYLLGAGPGLRYNYDRYLTARLDLGFKLHKMAAYHGGWAMVHFSLIGSF